MIKNNEIFKRLKEEGWVLVEGILSEGDLSDLKAAIWAYYPSVEEYESNPEKYSWLQGDQFAGLFSFPFSDLCLNNLPTHPAIVEFAETALGFYDIRLLRAGLQAKFAGAADYEQVFHYDYPNHTLVVPDQRRDYGSIGFFLYLSDVTIDLGPTYFISKRQAPVLNPRFTHFFRDPAASHTRHDCINTPELYELEVPAAGPAGSLLAYTTDTLHRGSAITATSGVRMTLGFAYGGSHAWEGFQCWPRLGEELDLIEFITKATPRQRELFGFPRIGDPYWTSDTISAVEARYPGIDLSTYRQGL